MRSAKVPANRSTMARNAWSADVAGAASAARRIDVRAAGRRAGARTTGTSCAKHSGAARRT
jgi:hypothetical protein